MKVRPLVMLVMTILVVAFVLLNWAAFTTPTPLSFGFGQIELPVGLITLSLTVLVTVAFLGYASYLRNSALIKAGLTAEELQTQRRLADQAEASRFTALRQYLENEFAQRAAADEAFRSEVRARLADLSGGPDRD